MVKKSNIYLNSPLPPNPNDSNFDKYLLENNVATNNNSNIPSFYINKIKNNFKFKLSDINIKTDLNSLIFFTGTDRVNGDLVYNGIWGKLNKFLYNEGDQKIKSQKKDYKYINFADIGTCPIFKRNSSSPTSWGTVRYDTAHIYENSGHYYFRYNNGNIEMMLDFGEWNTIIFNRKVIIVELQAAGGGGGAGAGYAGLTYGAMAGGGSGGSGAYGSFIIDLSLVGTIEIFVGAGNINMEGAAGDIIISDSYISSNESSSRSDDYILYGGTAGTNAGGYTAGLWGVAWEGKAGSGGGHSFPSTPANWIYPIQVIDGLNGSNGQHVAGGVGFANGGGTYTRGNNYSGKNIILTDVIGESKPLGSWSYGGTGIGGGLGFTQSRGGAASVLGAGGTGGNGNEVNAYPGIRGGGGGGGAGTLWVGGSRGGRGGNGYLIIH